MFSFHAESLTKIDEIKVAANLPSRSHVLIIAVDQLWKQTLLDTSNPPIITFTRSYDGAQDRTIAQLREIALLLEIADSDAAYLAIDCLWSKIIAKKSGTAIEQKHLVPEPTIGDRESQTVTTDMQQPRFLTLFGEFPKEIRKYVMTPGFVVLFGQIIIVTIDIMKHVIKAIFK